MILGCESGGGVNCTTNKKDAAGNIIAYKQSFLGFMLYNRWWFHKDRYAFTLGGGKINNPGRYLVLLPPINGATATTGTPYFTENPGRSVQGVGHLRNLRLHAKPVHHVPLGVQSPPRQRAVLERAGRSDASGREQRNPRSDHSGMVPGSEEDRGSRHHGNPGEVLKCTQCPSLILGDLYAGRSLDRRDGRIFCRVDRLRAFLRAREVRRTHMSIGIDHHARSERADDGLSDLRAAASGEVLT